MSNNSVRPASGSQVSQEKSVGRSRLELEAARQSAERRTTSFSSARFSFVPSRRLYSARGRSETVDERTDRAAESYLPMLTTLSTRTMDWVREYRDGVTAHHCKTRVFLFLYDPAGGTAAYVYMLLMCLLSVVQVTIWVLQESHVYNERVLQVRSHANALGGDDGNTASDQALFVISLALVSVFSAELLVRLGVHPSRKRLLRDGHMWIDLLSLVPLCARVYLGADVDTALSVVGAFSGTGRSWFRVLEALTALRLLRLARHFHGGMLLASALKRSVSALLVPFYMLCVIVLFFGGLIYACEGESLAGLAAAAVGDNGTIAIDLGSVDSTSSLSLPNAIWLMFITMTTVGYGDFSATSDSGKLITMIATLCGLIFISMPLAIVGDNFTEVWQNRLLDFVLGRIKDMLHVRTVPDCVHAFEAFDIKSDGWIDWVKFKRGCRRALKLRIRVSQLYHVWEQMDKSGTGQVSLLEWCELFFPDAEREINELVRSMRKMRKLASSEEATKAKKATSPRCLRGLIGSALAANRLAAAAAAADATPPMSMREPPEASGAPRPTTQAGTEGPDPPQQPPPSAGSDARCAARGGGRAATETETTAAMHAVEARLAAMEYEIAQMAGMLRRALRISHDADEPADDAMDNFESETQPGIDGMPSGEAIAPVAAPVLVKHGSSLLTNAI
jgi:hypothetical protein